MLDKSYGSLQSKNYTLKAIITRLLDSDLSFKEKKILCKEKGYKLKTFSHARGTLFPYHAHAYQEILVVKKGHIRLIVEEKIIDIHEKEYICIEPWAIHLLAFSQEDSDYYYLASPSFLNHANA